MRRILTIMVLMMSIFGTIITTSSMTIQAAGTKTKALKAYAKMLKKPKVMIDALNKRDSDMSCVSFRVVDANHDGTPELYLEDTSSVVGALFTYYGGKVRHIDQVRTGFGSYAFYQKGSTYSVGHMIRGAGDGELCKIQKGKRKVVASHSIIDSAEKDFKIGKRKVSKGKFNQYLKKMTKRSSQLKWDMHEVTAENIKKYLK